MHRCPIWNNNTYSKFRDIVNNYGLLCGSNSSSIFEDENVILPETNLPFFQNVSMFLKNLNMM